MSSWTTLTLSTRAAGVAQVTMSRPDVFNAFDETMIRELGEAFNAFLAKRPANWIPEE